MVARKKPPAKVDQPRAVRIATAMAKESHSHKSAARWAWVAKIIERTNRAQAEWDASIRGVQIPAHLARLPVMTHPAGMSLHDDSAAALPVIPPDLDQMPAPPPMSPPIDLVDIPLSRSAFRAYERLADRGKALGVHPDVLLEHLLDEALPK
jgi:hypothetical protein